MFSIYLFIKHSVIVITLAVLHCFRKKRSNTLWSFMSTKRRLSRNRWALQKHLLLLWG